MAKDMRECPECGSTKLSVADSKPRGRDSLVFQFLCTVCKHKWWEK